MKDSPPAAARSDSSLADPHLRVLRWSLVVWLAVMGVAVGWKALAYPGELFSFLFMGRGWSEDAALAASRAAAGVLVAASLLSPWRRAWPALVVIAAWMSCLSVLAMTGPVERPALIPGEHAVRILGPLVLVWLLAPSSREIVSRHRERIAIAVLRLACAATFACHGFDALAYQPAFLDYVFAAGDRLLGWEIEHETAESILVVIGVVDLMVSGAVLCWGRLQPLAMAALIYMVVWGFITAASRTLHSGVHGLFDTFMRLPNGGVPLALVLYWSVLSRLRRGRTE